jgi:methyl-accepting chemotaxis protein
MASGTDRVSHGMEITARAGDSLKRIIAATDHVESMIAQIATASTQQSVTAQEFSQNLETIHRLGEEGAAATPVTRGLVESVTSGAAHLQESVRHFRIADSFPAGNRERGTGNGMQRTGNREQETGKRSRPHPTAPRAAAHQPAPTFGD